MTSDAGRIAWLSVTPDEQRILSLAVEVGLEGAGGAAFESLQKKAQAHSGSRFGAIRLTRDEVDSVGPAFRALVQELKHWDSDAISPSVRQKLVDAYPGLVDGSVSAGVLSQRVQAFRVRIGLQKAWTKSGGVPAGED